jgi:60 kDa SS-A/Ro ribonucleoprotein
MNMYLKGTATRVGRKATGQRQRTNELQVENSEGGYVYPVTDWVRLDRFLVLGSESGTFYASEQKLSKDNVDAVERAIKADGQRVVDRVVEISHAGRAPKNDPALFVLAMCTASTDEKTRIAALDVLPKVARTGTHLLHFAAYVDSFRGWGRGLRSAVNDWYLQKPIEALQNQLVKYQSRDGWSHRDLLRLTHPEATARQDSPYGAAFRWVCGGMDSLKERTVQKGKGEEAKTTKYPDVTRFLSELPLISAFEQAKGFAIDSSLLEKKEAEEKGKIVAAHVKEHEQEVADLVGKFDLTHEMIPSEFKSSLVVWEALFQKMPMTAMIRNLANMTRIGFLAPLSDVSKRICARLKDQAELKKARIHPLNVLVALKTYEAGIGLRSKGEGWKPVSQVTDALDEAFYLAFSNVEPTGKRWYLGLDVSGSMGGSMINGVPNLSAREASAALSLVTARTESEHVIRAFSDSASGRRVGKKARPSMHTGYDCAMVPITFSPKERLDDAVRKTSNLPFGGTDCALPMLDALEENLKVDVFVVYTDSETWAGDIEPAKALKMYREQTGIPAKLVVMGMTSNEFTLADPRDGGMMDIVGFDAAVPQVMADFVLREPAQARSAKG